MVNIKLLALQYLHINKDWHFKNTLYGRDG